MVQLLRAANALLAAEPGAAERRLAAPTFDVAPLGARLGLLQWVRGGVPLWALFRAWQARRAGAPGAEPAAGAPGAGAAPSGAEMFYARLLPALEAAGLSRATPRAAWPPALLAGVFRGLAADAPADLLARELDAAARSAADAWARRAAFGRSAAVMSVLGWLLGLGDRHLGNLLLDARSGALVHIDFGVLFERGRRLRVPELVPFRLTQTLRGALGVAGAGGRFRAGCEAALGALCAGGPALGALLAAQLADPLVDWAAERDDRHARQARPRPRPCACPAQGRRSTRCPPPRARPASVCATLRRLAAPPAPLAFRPVLWKIRHARGACHGCAAPGRPPRARAGPRPGRGAGIVYIAALAAGARARARAGPAARRARRRSRAAARAGGRRAGRRALGGRARVRGTGRRGRAGDCRRGDRGARGRGGGAGVRRAHAAPPAQRGR